MPDWSVWFPPRRHPIVLNPLIAAELRRWRARPMTYLAIILIVMAIVVYRRDLSTAAMGAFPPPWGRYASMQLSMLFRPSSILPLLMVWRALVTFRDDGMFRPFRTTFLTPSDYLRGIVTVPFILSAFILIGYTGLELMPQYMVIHFSRAPEERHYSFVTQNAAVLYEGFINGVLICFLALYFGNRGAARLSALIPVVAITFVVQGVQAWAMLNYQNSRVQAVVNAVVDRLEIENLEQHVRVADTLIAAGTIKLMLAWVVWMMTIRWIGRQRSE